jgi:hypothetical protein
VRRTLVVLALAAAGCGGGEEHPSEPPKRKPVTALTCAELRDRPRLQRVSRELVVKVVAPDGQSEAETADLIAGSLRATCAQPGSARDRPVRPVLRAVQQHLDEEAIFEEGG